MQSFSARAALRSEQRTLDLRKLHVGKLPTGAAGRFANLVGPFGAAKRRGDARLVKGPLDHQFGNRMAGRQCNRFKPIDQIVILLPLLALEDRVFVPAVIGSENLIATNFSRQEPFHERPVDKDRHIVSPAPRQRIGLDLARQHVVRRLKGRQGTLGCEFFELCQRKIGCPDRSRFSFFQEPPQPRPPDSATGTFGSGE